MPVDAPHAETRLADNWVRLNYHEFVKIDQPKSKTSPPTGEERWLIQKYLNMEGMDSRKWTWDQSKAPAYIIDRNAYSQFLAQKMLIPCHSHRQVVRWRMFTLLKTMHPDHILRPWRLPIWEDMFDKMAEDASENFSWMNRCLRLIIIFIDNQYPTQPNTSGEGIFGELTLRETYVKMTKITVPLLTKWIIANPETVEERKPLDSSVPTTAEINRVVHLKSLRVNQLETARTVPLSLEDRATASKHDEELDGLQKKIEASSAQSESHRDLRCDPNRASHPRNQTAGVRGFLSNVQTTDLGSSYEQAEAWKIDLENARSAEYENFVRNASKIDPVYADSLRERRAEEQPLWTSDMEVDPGQSSAAASYSGMGLTREGRPQTAASTDVTFSSSAASSSGEGLTREGRPLVTGTTARLPSQIELAPIKEDDASMHSHSSSASLTNIGEVLDKMDAESEENDDLQAGELSGIDKD